MKVLKYIFATSLAILLGCQDSEISPKVENDPDMEAAFKAVDDFFGTSRLSKEEVDVIVIKYKKEELLYKTNTIKGAYSPIEEETVTAVTVIDGYVFWFKAGGVKALEEIELDDASEELLGDCEPFEIKEGWLWGLHIPDDKDLHGAVLKYDIVYEIWSGEEIRLDPKIQIKHPE